MARGMRAPPGAWQRAALVAVPLALVVLIIVTPALIGQKQPQPTDIPVFHAEVMWQPWNGTVNETLLLYVKSALGTPLYDYLAINASAVRGPIPGEGACGGVLSGGGNASCSEGWVPSLWFKVPMVVSAVVNVTAMAILGETTFRFNATFEVTWTEPGLVFRVQPEGASVALPDRDAYTVAMQREVRR